jgi:hypothetical protein
MGEEIFGDRTWHGATHTLPPGPAEKTSLVLDRWAELIRSVNG